MFFPPNLNKTGNRKVRWFERRWVVDVTDEIRVGKSLDRFLQIDILLALDKIKKAAPSSIMKPPDQK